MDFLDCSRTLMSSAIETRRTIMENHSEDFLVILELAAAVRPADRVLKQNLDAVSKKLQSWKLYMQLEKPQRYRKVERIVKNEEKNINLAREIAIDIVHWLHIDLPLNSDYP